ncbi:MAG: TRAP transporter substrate-binding protein DctP [Pseudomonadota bacterium]
MFHRFLLCLCTLVLTATSFTVVAEPITFRISLNTGPNHVRNIALQNFVDTLAARTEGKLDVQLFPSGQLFKGPDVPKALAQGGLEMGVPVILYLAKSVPNTGITDLPMFYGRSAQEFHDIMDGPLGKELSTEIEEKLGVKVIGPYLDLGFGTIFTSETPATSLASLQGLKMRVPGSPASSARYRELGVSSVSIPLSDLPIALAQKTVDGLMTTHETVRSTKLWESGIRYALDTQETFVQYVPMVGKPTWDKIGPELQKIITDTWNETIVGARALAAQRQASARDEGIKNGITATTTTQAERRAFRQRLMAKQDEIVSQVRMDPDFVARVNKALGN